MYHKYFVWSFDDGLEQDKKIIEILKEYKMGATFHLNSGLYGDKTYEGRVSNLGIIELSADTFRTERRHLMPFVPHFRIPEDEVVQVYEGFEVAGHSRTHKNLTRCNEEGLRHQIDLDIKALSEKFGYPITGFAYPFGMVNDMAVMALKNVGVQYARTTKSTDSFRFPEDPLRMPMTGWHISGKIFDKLNSFFEEQPIDDDLFFLMFAHGYEFDFNTKESNWTKFRKICETVSSHDDIVCCSIGEAFRRHTENQ